MHEQLRGLAAHPLLLFKNDQLCKSAPLTIHPLLGFPLWLPESSVSYTSQDSENDYKAYDLGIRN